MKLTALSLMLSLSAFAANADAQQVSVTVSNAKVKTVLNSISDQTGLSLAYSAQVVDLNRKVSLNFVNTEVSEVLNAMFGNTAIGYEIKDGVIVDKSGNAVPADKLAEVAGQLKNCVSDATKAIYGKEIQMYIDTSRFQRKVCAAVCQIKDFQTWILLFNKAFIHKEGFRIFVDDDIFAVLGEIFQMIVDKKPGIYIGFADYFFVKACFFHRFQHVIIGTLKKADEIRGQIFVKFPGKIRGILKILILIGSHQDPMPDPGMIAAAAG